jgi:hypothetical protein
MIATSRSGDFCLVPRVGLEPTRYCYHRILNPARLPVPPPRHEGQYIKALYRVNLYFVKIRIIDQEIDFFFKKEYVTIDIGSSTDACWVERTVRLTGTVKTPQYTHRTSICEILTAIFARDEMLLQLPIGLTIRRFRSSRLAQNCLSEYRILKYNGYSWFFYLSRINHR